MFTHTPVLHFACCIALSSARALKQQQLQELEIEESQFCDSGTLQASPTSGGPEGDEHDCMHDPYRDVSEGVSFESLLCNILDVHDQECVDWSVLYDLEISELVSLFDLDDDMFVSHDEYFEVMADYSFDCTLMSDFACWFLEQTNAQLVFFSGR